MKWGRPGTSSPAATAVSSACCGRRTESEAKAHAWSPRRARRRRSCAWPCCARSLSAAAPMEPCASGAPRLAGVGMTPRPRLDSGSRASPRRRSFVLGVRLGPAALSVRRGNGACHAVCLSVCRVRLLRALSSFDLRAAPLKLCARELPGATGAAGMPHSPYVLCGCAQGDVFVFDAESQQVCCVGAHPAHRFNRDLAPTSRIYAMPCLWRTPRTSVP